MKKNTSSLLLLLPLAAALLLTGCGRGDSTAHADHDHDHDHDHEHAHHHEHIPPHGGTPVVLGEEVYHLELVLDAETGTLRAYVFDGELENFIRSSVPSFSLHTTINGSPQTLSFNAIPNPATGETVGDTSLFEAHADWLKTTANFDATLDRITIRGTTFSEVSFNFPQGNDQD